MVRFIRNPWLAILLLPPAVFMALALLGVQPDLIVQTFSFLLFLVLAIAASKYALRWPTLIRDGNVQNDSLNIGGWSVVLISLMAAQAYRWVFISLDRPTWLVESYWNPALVYTLFFGFVLVAWSTRRTTPKPPTGRIGLGGFFVGFLSALGLMLSGILPAVTKFVIGLFQGLLRVF